MPVTPTYPGVYIQELPSSVHSISPAPTSIAVFIGYTHPFLTENPGVPVQCFSFADYQRNFGGFFSSPWQVDYVGQAVFQFFINGGATCYVVGLKSQHVYDSNGTQKFAVLPATAEITDGTGKITLTATQPAGIAGSGVTTGILMQVTVSNLAKTTNTNDTADVVISYGTTVETYRKVLIAPPSTPTPGSMSLDLVSALASSSLVTAAAGSPAPTAFEAGTTTFTYTGAASSTVVPDTNLPWSVIEPSGVDFLTALGDGQPLDKVTVFNLLVLPGITTQSFENPPAAAFNVLSDALSYCERKRAFLILDSPPGVTVEALITGLTASTPTTVNPISTNGAIYFPWLQTADPLTGAASTSPPSGFVAGMFAQEDNARGVWKSPAGLETALLGTPGVVPGGVMTDMQQGVLNNQAINSIRQFPGLTPVIFGARTLAYTDLALKDQWGYVAVRRMALFLEQSLYANLTWAVFEPNDTPLWNALTQEVSAFMLSLFRQGAFAGTTPRQAFLVQCDSTTTTPTDVANGIVNILVAFAPLRPAEFVVVQIAQMAGQASS